MAKNYRDDFDYSEAIANTQDAAERLRSGALTRGAAAVLEAQNGRLILEAIPPESPPTIQALPELPSQNTNH